MTLPSSFEFDATDLAATQRLARALAAHVPGGSLVTLDGELGAGKTCLVRALTQAWGVPPDDVNSPTFVLVNEYQGVHRIYHLDAYRLRDEDEFMELGADEWLESSAITLIEWADRIRQALPVEHLSIRIDVTGDTARRFRFEAHGERYQAVLECLSRDPLLVERA